MGVRVAESTVPVLVSHCGFLLRSLVTECRLRIQDVITRRQQSYTVICTTSHAFLYWTYFDKLGNVSSCFIFLFFFLSLRNIWYHPKNVSGDGVLLLTLAVDNKFLQGLGRAAGWLSQWPCGFVAWKL
jgi:hypothetical protein